jgi:2-haloacid dehalogenase
VNPEGSLDTLVLDFNRYQVLTFDCYGTLIDWETGILNALRPVFSAHGVCTTDDQILELYGRIEAEIEAQPYQLYRTVLQRVVVQLGVQFDFRVTAQELDCLPESIAKWPPFEDTVEALRRLKSKYKLGIISNIDTDLLDASLKLLKVPFDFVTTAQEVGAYKPSPVPFERSLQKIGAPKERILHVAQSLYHDHVTAKRLGFDTVWINRHHAVPGTGATPEATASPDVECPDLVSMADAAGV